MHFSELGLGYEVSYEPVPPDDQIDGPNRSCRNKINLKVDMVLVGLLVTSALTMTFIYFFARKPPLLQPSSTSTILTTRTTEISHSDKSDELPSTTSLHSFDIPDNGTWTRNGITVAGGNGKGSELYQFSYPNGLFVDDDETIYIADTGNNRIVEWKVDARTGHVVAGGNEPGNRTDQLGMISSVIVNKEKDGLIICDSDNQRVMRWPLPVSTSGETIISDLKCMGLAMNSDGFLYISDVDKHDVRRWRVGESYGIVVAGGNRKGDRLDQLNYPTSVFVDQNHTVYVTDNGNQRIMKWVEGAKEGVIVAGGYGPGNDLTQLSGPKGIVVDHVGTVYVADWQNGRIMRWSKGASQGSVFTGGNGIGDQANQLILPGGLALNSHGYLYVVDTANSRVQRFNIDRNLLS